MQQKTSPCLMQELRRLAPSSSQSGGTSGWQSLSQQLQKKGLVTDFFAVKLRLTSCLDVEVEDFGEVGVSQSVGGEHSHVVHRLVLQVPDWSKASKRSEKMIFTSPQYVRAGGGEREASRRARLGLT